LAYGDSLEGVRGLSEARSASEREMRDGMGEESRSPLEGLLEIRREVRKCCPELAPREERVAYGVEVVGETGEPSAALQKFNRLLAAQTDSKAGKKRKTAVKAPVKQGKVGEGEFTGASLFEAMRRGGVL
jgi:hypothetical protein